MDEAFLPLHLLVPELLPQIPDLVDEDAGTRSRVTAYEVSTPVELDITAVRGDVQIGSVPPLYHLDTSFFPVLHQLRVVAVCEELPR